MGVKVMSNMFELEINGELHLKSGIESFDVLTNGGLPHCVSLVSSISGLDTKSLMLQMAIAYCNKGIPVLYVSTDRTLDNFFSTVIPDNSEFATLVVLEEYECPVYEKFINGIELMVKTFKNSPVVIVEDLNWLGRTCDTVDVDAVDEDGESIYDANDGVLRAYSGLNDISHKYNCRILANYTLGSDVKVGQEVSLCNMDYPEELDSMSHCVLGVEVEISKENLDNYVSGNNYNVKVRNLADKFGAYVEKVIEYDVTQKLFLL